MNKKYIALAVSASLLSMAAISATSTQQNSSKIFKDVASVTVERQFDGRVFLEFTKPTMRLQEGEAQRLVAELSEQIGIALTYEEIFMKRFVVVKLTDYRNDSDVTAAVSRMISAPSVLSAKPNRFVKTQAVDSFVNPGWSSQFNVYSADQDFNGNPYVNNPRILELIDFFDNFDFGETRLSLVDSFFEEVPNLPHSAYVQRQTILNGEFSPDLIDRGSSIAHGLTMAAYLKGQPNSTYGTVGIGYNTLPLLAITVFDPQTNQATDFDVARGMLYSLNLHDSADTNPNPNPATVVNLSLGSGGNVCSDSAVYQAAIDMINNSGGLVVAAAGNLGQSELNIPSNCENVIAVGAAGYNGNIANFSNYSPDLTVSAISSTFETDVGAGNGALFTTDVILSPDGPQDGVTTVSGTSIAAPYISALLTYAKAVNPTLTFADAKELLQRNSIPFRAEDTRCAGLNSCAGIIDPVAFVQEVSSVDLLSFNQYSTAGTLPPDEENPTDPTPPADSSDEPITVSISGTASNPTDVQVFLEGQPVEVTSLETAQGSITIEFGGANQFEVRFNATPNTNASSVSPSSSARYRFTVDTTTVPATVSSIERLSDPTVPGATTSAPSGGGGGGSLSLGGLLGLASLLALFNRRKKSGVRID